MILIHLIIFPARILVTLLIHLILSLLISCHMPCSTLLLTSHRLLLYLSIDTQVVILVERFALLYNRLWQSPLILSEDASLHVVLRHLLAEGFLEAVRVDIKN